MPDDGLIRIMLDAAVPFWIWKHRDTPDELRQARGRECSQVVAEHGDAILYRVPGQTANAFNCLAEGIALLAFAPGGVEAFGRRWVAEEMLSAVPSGEQSTREGP